MAELDGAVYERVGLDLKYVVSQQIVLLVVHRGHQLLLLGQNISLSFTFLLNIHIQVGNLKVNRSSRHGRRTLSVST